MGQRGLRSGRARGSIFAKSTDGALFCASREAEPRDFSGDPIQKWPARDPTLGRHPPHAEFVARHVRRIYKKEEVKEHLIRDLKGFG